MFYTKGRSNAKIDAFNFNTQMNFTWTLFLTSQKLQGGIIYFTSGRPVLLERLTTIIRDRKVEEKLGADGIYLIYKCATNMLKEHGNGSKPQQL